MILYDSKNRKYYCYKTVRPRFSSYGGRTWDKDTKTIDGQNVGFNFDSSRGYHFYFSFNDAWYGLRFWYGEGEAGWDATTVKDFFTTVQPIGQKEE